MDYNRYVNVFQGCEEIDLPKPEGLAKKWFFIKAQCGNTSPAATGPFGAMSITPYTGGYPTGYGNHLVNTHAKVGRFEDGNYLRGFTHLNQTGTGTILFYYNFLLVTPRYDLSRDKFTYTQEKARPGYYSCLLDGSINCEVTACGKIGAHRYTFDREGGFATVDFSQQGLKLPGNSNQNQEPAKVISLKEENGTVTAAIGTEGIVIYFALKSDGEVRIDENRAVFTAKEKQLNIKVAVSLTDGGTAVKALDDFADFDEIKSTSYGEWNSLLSRFDIETSDEKIKEIFYSNLYHSFVKPCDFDGESFVYDKGKPFITDFSTLWDMYKTQLPLIFMTHREMGEKICETILSLGEKLGELPNSFGLNTRYSEHAMQARMLGDYVLLTAYRYGILTDVKRMMKVITADIFADNKKDFTVDGKCGSETWMLDMADGCGLALQVALDTGDFETAEKLRPLAEKWRTAFDEKTGLLNADSTYYEGSLYTYSFRYMLQMDERIKLAGGKEKFTALLDSFFGYGRPDTRQAVIPDGDFMKTHIDEGRFDGTNNESDTETPFSYISVGRHDRTCEILSACMKYMYTTGRGGLPGNNDTGALSSWYCLNALGLWPVAGHNLFFFGTPVVDNAVIMLYNGKELEINVHGNSPENIYVEKILFNSREITDYSIPADELMKGGRLEFFKTADKK